MSLTLSDDELTRAVESAMAPVRELAELRLTEEWSPKQVALYLGLNPDHVSKNILTRSDFPRAAIIPGTGTGRSNKAARRYRSSEVREWCDKFRA